LHKLLVQDRITEFDRVLKVYKDAIKTRLEYINNYEIEEPENIESMDFGRRELLNGSGNQVSLEVNLSILLAVWSI
jgi:uncharacterized protein (UPF0262 family)